MRIAVAGFPRAGKTTAFPDALHTDDTKDLMTWDDSIDAVAAWFDSPDPDLVVEGVIVPHALRRIKRAGKPCPVDKLIFFTTPRQKLSGPQRQLGETQRTIVEQLANWLPAIEWRR